MKPVAAHDAHAYAALLLNCQQGHLPLQLARLLI
jgi:hypothetical protein